MNRLWKVWLGTLLIYGGIAALLIFVMVPSLYNAGFMIEKDGASISRYQRVAVPCAIAGYLLLAGSLSLSVLRSAKQRPAR